MVKGWVKGLSMWPNLIPGDILSAREIPASGIRPGMITVFKDSTGNNPVVHRVQSLRRAGNKLLVTTAGDNSGTDNSGWIVNQGSSVTVVSGVLRLGRYRTVTHFRPLPFFNRRSVRRVHLFLVKHIFW